MHQQQRRHGMLNANLIIQTHPILLSGRSVAVCARAERPRFFVCDLLFLVVELVVPRPKKQ